MSKPLVSDELWAIVAPFLPPERPRPRGGRPRSVPNRAARTGILFVLKKDIPWEMVPQELGCGSGMTPAQSLHASPPQPDLPTSLLRVLARRPRK